MQMMHNQAITTTEYIGTENRQQPTRHPLAWLLGNLLLISGLYLLLYVGGLYADAEYEQWAARGDNNLEPAAVVSLEPTEPNAFVIPALNRAGETPRQTAQQAQAQYSTITRLLIPKVELDSKVIEVGWEIVEENGQEVAVWQVAKYAVGHHQGSGNPGSDDNIVLAGHVGGAAPVFKDLNQLEAGDQVVIFSQGRQYLYVVDEKVLVQEVGVAEAVRLENARYIAPTDEEMVTLITCWPPTGPNKFDQRLIVRAVPYGKSVVPSTDSGELSNWSIR